MELGRKEGKCTVFLRLRNWTVCRAPQQEQRLDSLSFILSAPLYIKFCPETGLCESGTLLKLQIPYFNLQSALMFNLPKNPCEEVKMVISMG